MTDFGAIITETILKFNITQPFNQYYANIIEKKLKIENVDYTVYIARIQKTQSYKINCLDCNSYSNLRPTKYSTKQIPIYMRTKKELELMLDVDYYDKFMYNDVITEGKILPYTIQ